MKPHRPTRRKQSESGVALLIAIFAVMLVSAVAVTLIVASGSESSLAGNYRSSTSAYYAGFAGLEEGRGRVVPGNPNPINVLAGLATPYLPVGTFWYIVNPAPGENAATILATYPDTERGREFPALPAPVILPPINSVSTVGGVPGPLYKWVRINAPTEQSLNINVNGGGMDTTTPLFYDAGLTPPSLIVPPTLAPGVPNPPPSSRQALEVTALAVLPDGSRKTTQYVIAPVTLNLNFPSALTLAGNVGNFNGASSNQYFMNGIDGSGNPPGVPGCVPSQPPVPAIGVSPGVDPSHDPQTNEQYVETNLPRPDHYIGQGGVGAATVSSVSLTGNLQTPATLANLLQTIKDNADAVVAPSRPGDYYNFGGPGWPTDMSESNPKVVFVDGNFDTGPNTGYGILVVTGNFLYHGNSGWKGIVLVIGDGTTTFDGLGGGNGEFDGAIYVATIRDASGNLLPSLGTVNFDIAGGGGNGIYYNSCWINRVQQPPSYLVLSFREISQ